VISPEDEDIRLLCRHDSFLYLPVELSSWASLPLNLLNEIPCRVQFLAADLAVRLGHGRWQARIERLDRSLFRTLESVILMFSSDSTRADSGQRGY
ncbi:MAG: hypothetical protein ACLPWG_04680, partial [Steroidobacteraceae bacterium]